MSSTDKRLWVFLPKNSCKNVLFASKSMLEKKYDMKIDIVYLKVKPISSNWDITWKIWNLVFNFLIYLREGMKCPAAQYWKNLIKMPKSVLCLSCF